MGFAPSTMQLTSPAFGAGGAIPAKFTGEGEDVSPAFDLTDVPEGTRSIALICHDPDAPLVQKGTYGYVHWVLYDLPADTRSLDEGTDVGTAGKNDFGNTGYGGPMPPEGHGVHHYYFWVMAFNEKLSLDPGLTLWEFLAKSEPNLIGMNRLIGTYQRG